jgi:hypothetical protein
MHPAPGGFGVAHPAQPENEEHRRKEVAEFGEKGSHRPQVVVKAPPGFTFLFSSEQDWFCV